MKEFNDFLNKMNNDSNPKNEFREKVLLLKKEYPEYENDIEECSYATSVNNEIVISFPISLKNQNLKDKINEIFLEVFH